MEHLVLSEAETAQVAAWLLGQLSVGDTVELIGPLGAGKTTFVRALLRAAGHHGPVKSPTYNLIQTYATRPPILHADLYRVTDAVGTGLEDLIADHVNLIEWPAAAASLIDPKATWRVEIAFGDGATERMITLTPPPRV